MFSMANLMNPFEQRGNQHTVPFFVDFGSPSQPNRCPRSRGPSASCRNRDGACNNPCVNLDSEYSSRMFSPLADVLQHVFEHRMDGKTRAQRKTKENGDGPAEKKTTPQRKRKGDTPSKDGHEESKSQKEMDPPKPAFQDIINHAMSSLREWNGEQNVAKWKQQVDCRGFDSNNIKVKVEGRELLLKAFKKQESENGERTMSMRKRVPLPENVDTKQIKCKLSSNGSMIIEAPYLDQGSQENALDFVNGVMTAMLPGLEQLLRPNSNPSTETPVKGNCSDKCTDTCEKTCGEVVKETASKKETQNFKVDETNQEHDEKHLEKKLPTSDTNTSDASSKMADHELDTDETSPVMANPTSIADVNGDKDTHVTEEHVQNGDSDCKEREAQDEDADSVSTEDSFVLLSELEKENTSSDDTPSHISVANEEDAKDKEKESTTNYNGEIMEVNDNHHSEIEERDAENQPSVESDSQQKYTTETENSQNTDCSNETDKVLFRLEMPSYNPESMKVTFDNTKRLLSVSASKELTRPGSGSPAEVKTRSVSVDDDIDVNKLQCFFRDGTLTVTAPLKSTVTTIPIKS